MKQFILFNLVILLCFHSSSIASQQQQYTANQALNCKTKHEFLYTCNGENPSCQSFLIFKSKPPFDSVPTISALMSSNPHELALINNVTETFVFPNDKQVVVPVNCSCSDHRYQAITIYRLSQQLETYFTVANLTFQGLSTCSSLKRANSYGEFDLEDGFELKVPLHCACPTKDQVLRGTKYLLTYSIVFKDNVNDIARRFNVSAESVLKANGFSETHPTLFPFTTILIPLAAEPSISETLETTTVSAAKRTKAEKPLKAGIAAVCSFLLLITVVLVTVLVLKRKAKIQDSEEMTPKDLLVEIASFERIIKAFSFQELQKATNNFSPKHNIKGSVYRGVFGNQIAAVKKTSINVSKQVNMLSKINHINLTKLYGFCNNQDTLYLVFEYMPMGSLREFLTGEKSKETHSLCNRIQIAIDVAHGLHYLHNFANPKYVHKNVNSSNILLDSNLRAKISNFSLARTTDNRNDDNSNTSRIVGSRGYMAPEYVGNGSVSAKVDVYSFGVVIMELVTGKCAVFREGDEDVLLSTAMGVIMEGVDAEMELMCMCDLANEEGGRMECAVEMVKLGLMCVRKDPGGRPSMDEVVSCLVRIYFDFLRSVRRRMFRKPDHYNEMSTDCDDEEDCNV